MHSQRVTRRMCIHYFRKPSGMLCENLPVTITELQVSSATIDTLPKKPQLQENEARDVSAPGLDTFLVPLVTVAAGDHQASIGGDINTYGLIGAQVVDDDVDQRRLTEPEMQHRIALRQVARTALRFPHAEEH
jgi:hypothetical protein